MKQRCMTYSSIFLGTQGIASCLHASSHAAFGDMQALHMLLLSTCSMPVGEQSRSVTCSSWPQTQAETYLKQRGKKHRRSQA